MDDACVLLRTTFETDATTVGGLVTAALGHLPSEGEQVVICDFELTVERMAGRAVETMIARRIAEPSQEDEA